MGRGLVGSEESAVARMRLLLVLLGFLLAACLADDKYQAENGGGLSLNAKLESEPELELNLRAKGVPKKTNSIRVPKNSNSNKPNTQKTKKNKSTGRKRPNSKKVRNQKKEKERKKKANGNQEKRKIKKRKKKLSQKKKKKDKKKLKEKKGAKTERKTSESRQCTPAPVSDECLTNALNVMIWEGEPVKNFLKKYSRFTKFTEQTGNKNAKKSKFQDVAGFLSEGAGGNMNNITCESNSTTSNSRRVSEYKERYNELGNCSASVEEACSNFTIPEDWDELVACHKNVTNPPHFFNSTSKIKDLVQECVTLKSEDATAHCTCLENINNREDVKSFKDNKCIKKMDKTQKAMKEFKRLCLNAFGACRTAQKDAPGLVVDCMNMEESHNTEVKVDNSTARLFV